jgi:hypothetical protein
VKIVPAKTAPPATVRFMESQFLTKNSDGREKGAVFPIGLVQGMKFLQ